MQRRHFISGACAVAACFAAEGCVFSNVYKLISKYVPVALMAFDRVTSILEEHGIAIAPALTTFVTAVKAALADIETAVRMYQDAKSDGKQTALQAVLTALQVAQICLEDFWNHLQIPNPQLASTVRMLLQVIISTLAGFATQLRATGPVAPTGPVPKAPGAAPKAAPKAAHDTDSAFGAPKPRSIEAFKHDFNAVLVARNEAKFVLL